MRGGVLGARRAYNGFLIFHIWVGFGLVHPTDSPPGRTEAGQYNTVASCQEGRNHSSHDNFAEQFG